MARPKPVPAKPPPAETVSVRMYRGLLGDCFLLTHRRVGSEPFRALIDCGVLQRIGTVADKGSTEEGLQRIRRAVDSLAKETKRLDLVIATHEHYDHLSGFILKNDVFATLEIGEVWLAWTENHNDELANAIRADGKKALSALKSIASQPGLALGDQEAADRIKAIEDLMQFYDDDIELWTAPGALGAAPARPPYVPGTPPRSCANVIAWLKHRVGEARVRYLEPGQVIAFGLDNALKANVLGPPRRADRLLQLNPTAGEQREVYLAKPDQIRSLETTLRFKQMLPAAASDGVVPSRPVGAVDRPFPDRFLRTQAALAKCPIVELYEYTPEATRRIDGEWLGTAEALALKIDSDVNNTSLALAIEVPGRHVLLFPADAQVGNWLSWHDQLYPAKPEKADAPTESAKDILGRVVLYKVGHHGSHNATAREQGLELMTSPHLVAMIPVVEKTAQEQKTRHNPKGWAMPYADLNKRLKEKTRERIVQGDGARVDEKARFDAAGSIFSLDYADKDGADPLWVELSLPIETAASASANPQTPPANTPIAGGAG